MKKSTLLYAGSASHFFAMSSIVPLILTFFQMFSDEVSVQLAAWIILMSRY